MYTNLYLLRSIFSALPRSLWSTASGLFEKRPQTDTRSHEFVQRRVGHKSPPFDFNRSISCLSHAVIGGVGARATGARETTGEPPANCPRHCTLSLTLGILLLLLLLWSPYVIGQTIIFLPCSLWSPYVIGRPYIFSSCSFFLLSSFFFFLA